MASHRERFYAVLRGEPADRIPFIGRIELFYNRLQARPEEMPESYRGLSMWDMARALGWGSYGQKANVYSQTYADVDVVEHQENGLLRIEYHTPVGMVWETKGLPSRLMQDADATLLNLEYAFKDEGDYQVLAYIFEHLAYEPAYEEWSAQESDIGPDGISRCWAGKCPIHAIMCRWMGYEHAIFEMHDRPSQMGWLLEVLTASYQRMQEIVLDSPADIVESGGNLTTMVTSPPLFRKYFLPYFLDFNARLIDAGKYPMCHVDGELGGARGGLVPSIREARFRIADAFTPPPVTSVDVREALESWEDEVLVFGGIPSMMFAPAVSDAEFEAYVVGLLRSIRPSDHFVLGFGDMIAMEADFQRVKLMSRLYAEYGEYANHA